MRKLFLTSMAVAAVCCASVQARTITGTVVDAANNEPLVGASVLPVAGGNGTAADINGKFTLNLPDNVKTAQFTYVGYKPQTVELTNGMTVYLVAEGATLDDLVVIGYGTATKESLTGSVTVVDSKSIEERPLTSATSALEGNAPGVQVNGSTGQPGSSPSIIIRGVGTITGTTAPCYVVDGVIFNGGIEDINPNDIESLTVLKDAASCAIYGVRASNGVVLITTKRAKKRDVVEVTLSVREGMYTRGLSEYERLGTNDWMDMTYIQASNYLMESDPKNYPTTEATHNYLATQGQLVNTILKGNNIFNLPADQLFDANGKFVGQVLPGYTDLDWWDAIHRTGLRQEYNLNVTSASEKYNMFASVGYLNEKGYLLRSDFERYNARFNVNVQPLDYFKFGVNMNASVQQSDYNSAAGGSTVSNPFASMFYAPIYPYYAHDPETGAILYDEKTGNPLWNMAGRNGDRRNVAYELRNDFNDFNYNVIDANAYATAIIPYGFEVTFRGNMFRSMTNYRTYQNNVLGDGAPIGRFSEEDDQVRYHTFQQYLNWAQSYGRNQEHNVAVMLGHENTTTWSAGNSFIVQNQIEDDYYAADNFTQPMGVPGGSYSESRIESYFARARYNFMEKYFIEGSIRRDGSDRFAKDNRWGTFWSVGGGWIITKEKFMEPTASWLDYAKLRLAYGTVGNYLAAPALSYMSLYGMNASMSNVSAWIRMTQGNPTLKWEAQKTLDVAIEGSLFRNRLSFNIGYFDKRSSDLIFNVAPPASVGVQIFSGSNGSMSTPMNIGSMSNHGWELSFNGTIFENQDWTVGASLDMTFITNTVKGLPYNGRDLPNGLQRLSEGRSIYDWYLPTYAGVDQLTGDAMYVMDYDQLAYYYNSSDSGLSKDQIQELWAQRLEQAQAEGSLIERNGKYYTSNTTFATKDWHGTGMPTVFGSFGVNASWKGIHLGALFTYSLGGDLFDSTYQTLMSVSGYTSAMHKDILKSWQQAPEGMTADSPNRIDPNGIPRINPSKSQDNNLSSTRFLTSADWLVLKNINVSYDLPQKWVRALKLQNINLGFSCDNLFTVAGRTGLNPQQTWSGQQSSAGTFVPSRVYSFQLTARF